MMLVDDSRNAEEAATLDYRQPNTTYSQSFTFDCICNPSDSSRIAIIQIQVAS